MGRRLLPAWPQVWLPVGLSQQLQSFAPAAWCHRFVSALAGVGQQPTGPMPAAQQPKKAVPEWLRAEMLSRGISLNAAGGA